MNIVKFKECNAVYAEDQPQYLQLPCHKTTDGVVTSCWSLNLKERLLVLFKGRIFLRLLTFNQPLQPLKMSVANPVNPDSQTHERTKPCRKSLGPPDPPRPANYHPVG